MGHAGLTVLVVSYNTKEITLDCLRSLEANIDASTTRVIIVDNDSPDGSADAIRDAFPKFELIALKENIGFAAANNLAAERAESEYLLLLNPDTVVLDDAIGALMRFADERPEAGVWGGRTLFKDGSLNIHSCHARPTPWTILCHALGLSFLFHGSKVFDREDYGWWLRDSVKDVDIVCGCFMLIRRHLWNELDGFDPDFFMYGEETDLCIRASKLGYQPAITPDATIIHYGGASDSVRVDKVVRLFDAIARLIRRHWSPILKPLGLVMLCTWPLVRAIPLGLVSIAGVKRASKPASSWWSIWRRRSEWLDPKPLIHSGA